MLTGKSPHFDGKPPTNDRFSIVRFACCVMGIWQSCRFFVMERSPTESLLWTQTVAGPSHLGWKSPSLLSASSADAQKGITENQSEKEAELEPEQCSACSGFEQNTISSNCRISKWILGLWAPIGRVYRGALRGFLSKEKLRVALLDVSCGLRDGYVHRRHNFLLNYYIGCCGSTISRCFGAGWCNNVFCQADVV